MATAEEGEAWASRGGCTTNDDLLPAIEESPILASDMGMGVGP